MRAFSLVLAVLISLAPLGARADRAATQRVSGQSIARLASGALRGLPAGDASAYVAAGVVPDQMVPAGSVRLSLGTPAANPSFVNVPVAIAVDGAVDRTVYVAYRLQRYVETAVAAHDLVPGTVLGADDLQMMRVPFAGRAANGVDALIGRRLNGTVLKGQPVAIESTSANQIVKAGSTVILIVRDGGVALSADVVARTGGGLGDQVSVWNPSTRKALSGTVTAPNTVELDISEEQAP